MIRYNGVTLPADSRPFTLKPLKDRLYRIRLVRILCRPQQGCSYVEPGGCHGSRGSMSATAGESPVAGELFACRITLSGNCHGNRRAQHNCRGAVAEDSNQANSI